MSENRKRSFADVITIEAWHSHPNSKSLKADLHADVVFGTARLGGEPDSPIRFRLSVKRAEVVVVIPPFEPVAVDTRSVSRDSPEWRGLETRTFEKKNVRSAAGKLKSIASITAESPSASAELDIKGTTSSNKKIEFTRKTKLMLVTQSKTLEGNYRWRIESATSEALDGRPWDAHQHPLLKLIDQRQDRTRGIPPSVRVEVRCLREDLNIFDIMAKDENLWRTIQARVGFRNRIAAAESYIRDHLIDVGLEVGCMKDSFGIVTFGSVVSVAT